MKQQLNTEKEEMDIRNERKELQEECGPVPACCASQSKIRSEDEYKDLIHRLNRVEGQIRGIRRMLEQDAYCIDVLNQVSAANCALNSFTKVLLANHIRSCVVDDVREGNSEKLEELVRTLQKMMK
ncbi:MAG: metal-sensing transcriptional repressor [Lachnospiraceae bacterium]|nr:metal-sensing transcriptional repressor [Lachnospiraceae bacterium]